MLVLRYASAYFENLRTEFASPKAPNLGRQYPVSLKPRPTLMNHRMLGSPS